MGYVGMWAAVGVLFGGGWLVLATVSRFLDYRERTRTVSEEEATGLTFLLDRLTGSALTPFLLFVGLVALAINVGAWVADR